MKIVEVVFLNKSKNNLTDYYDNFNDVLKNKNYYYYEVNDDNIKKNTILKCNYDNLLFVTDVLSSDSMHLENKERVIYKKLEIKDFNYNLPIIKQIDGFEYVFDLCENMCKADEIVIDNTSNINPCDEVILPQSTSLISECIIGNISNKENKENKNNSQLKNNSMFTELKNQFIPQVVNESKVTMDGNIAFKTKEGYVAINANNELVSYPEKLVFDFPAYSFAKPFNQVQVGEIIKHNETFYKVLEVRENNTLKLLSFSGYTSNKRSITNVLFNQSFVTVVFNMMSNIGSNNQMGNMLPMMMMMEKENGSEKSSMVETMMMMQMMGGQQGNNTMNGMNPMMMAMMMSGEGEKGNMMETMMMMQMMQQQNQPTIITSDYIRHENEQAKSYSPRKAKRNKKSKK